MDQQENQAGQEEPQVRAVETVEEMGNLILSWHHKVLHDIDHLMTLPEGSKTELYDAATNTTKEVVIEGDAYQTFLAAGKAIKAIVNTLPFSAVVSVEENAAPEAAASNDAEPA